ncbi:MAG: DUF3179 domain-containing protein [Ignavibacteriales bacterium]|nr:DUF3179 domain-containing protein [Ignavibacteriales bacterium]
MKNPKNIPFGWKTDTTKTEINLSELSIVLPRGSFQVLNYPGFVGKEEGLKSFFPLEPVISIEITGEAKAYPLNMLSVHEIANDSLAGIPILATFCPLCNSGIVYDRRLIHKGGNHLLDFEVSGMLRKSDMVMADKQTETWWQQLEGKAIVGELAGAELKVIPSLILSVKDFFDRYPNGKILSKSTGIKDAEESYGYNYYKNYDRTDGKPHERFFDPNQIDKRLPAMERVVDIRNRGEFKIYPFSVIAKTGVINDEFNSKNVVVFYKPGLVSVLDEKDITQSKDLGTVTVFNSLLDGRKLNFRKEGENFIDNTNSTWDITGRCISGKLINKQLAIEPNGIHFAFAWLAFHPKCEIYEHK